MKIKITIFFLCISIIAMAQNKTTIAGFVKDKLTGEALIGANVTELETTNGCFTDEHGYFSIKATIPAKLNFSYVGYSSFTIPISHAKDSLIIIQLESSNDLETIIIIAPQEQKSNVSSLQKAELMQIPALGGKPDVLKTAQMLPGIQAQNEGSSLLSVRGGDPGQNLYLIDNVPLIYVNHLGGFTSVFNPEMINSIDIYKGSFPSQYGGKLSSIMNITQRDGDISKIKGNYSIGLSDASFNIEGPTKIKNTSFIITGRKTILPDVLLYAASSLSRENYTRLTYGFHDINAKFTWKPNLYNTISLNGYQGDDYMNFFGKTNDQSFRLQNKWGNNLISLNWSRIITPKIRAVHIISYTRYRSFNEKKFTNKQDSISTKFESKDLSSKQEISIQSLWKYSPAQFWKIDFGVQSTLESFIPNYTYNSTLITQKPYSKIRRNETTFFVENTIKLGSQILLTPGIRTQLNSIDTYSNISFEPRIQLKYSISKHQSISIHYMEVYQTSHLLFTQGSIMTNEVWIPSGKTILPSHSSQYSLNWNSTLFQKAYTAECNIYYKQMENLITFKEGFSSISGDKLWEEKLSTNGTGTSQGIEVFIRKQTGIWRGFAGYSYSHTTRKFPNINNGEEYLYDFDRPHSFSITAMRNISEKWSVGINWVYQTGLPYTPVIGRQRALLSEPNFDGEPVYYESFIYGERNSGRMKDYHRLDLGFTYKGLNKYNQRTEWNFSIYNAYNRKNPYFYYYNHNNSGELYTTGWEQEYGYKQMKLYQISFFPIIPTVSYKVYLERERYRNKKSKSDNKTFQEKFKA